MTTKTKTADVTKAAAASAHELSQYYTLPPVVADCIAVVDARYGAGHFDTIIEPSAGTGAFSRQLGADCIALDLDPKAPDIETADFLTWKPTAPTGRCLVIGNPPFGKKAALAFLNRAAGFGDVIAFILPKTFCKKTQQNRVAKNLHLVHEEEIPADSFTHEGKIVDVPCVLQIWERRPVERVKHKLKPRHPHFERCTQAEADLVVRRVGAHAGQIKPLEKSWSAQSNIFLRATGCYPETLKARVSRLDMASQACNGAGGGSINMSEIVELYEEELAREAAAVTTNAGLAMVALPAEDESPAIAPVVEKTAAPALEGLAVEIDEEPRDVETQPEPRHVVIEASTGAATAKLAVARFNTAAASEANSITLTVPLSFRKMALQNRLDPQFHLVEDTDSEVRIAGANGRSRALPCAVQTWVRRRELRPKHALATRHPDFEFCDRAEADVAIQRVGGAAGRLKTPDEAGSAQSHLFLRAVGCSPAELWARLAAIDFDTVRHNTAAVPSVAKTEIVALYEATRSIAAAAAASSVPGQRVSAPTADRVKHLRRDESLVQSAGVIGAASAQVTGWPAGADSFDGKLAAPADPVS